MNSFFRTCVLICLFMLVFSLIANFVVSMGAFPGVTGIGLDVEDTGDALSTLTGLSDPSMNGIWLGVVTGTFFGMLALSVLIQSMTPIGLHLFSMVFWTSWIRMLCILSYGSIAGTPYIPPDFIIVFTVGVMFIFIAAIIGLITGGG